MVQDSTQRTDTTAVADSMAMPDSAMMTQVTAAPAPEAAGTWPVDPVTGQTIINGEPVVGRVFIMQKPDGLVKLGTWQAQYAGEPAVAEPARVGTSYTVPAPEQTRRMRGIMIQATLWGMDGKRSASEHRYYRGESWERSWLGYPARSPRVARASRVPTVGEGRGRCAQTSLKRRSQCRRVVHARAVPIAAIRPLREA